MKISTNDAIISHLSDANEAISIGFKGDAMMHIAFCKNVLRIFPNDTEVEENVLDDIWFSNLKNVEELDEWFESLDSTLTEKVCNNSLFDYENEETFDKEGNCNWDIYYAKSRDIWCKFTSSEKLRKYFLYRKD